MEHFKVLVITQEGQTVDELLEPFGINAKYKEKVIISKKELIRNEKKQLEKIIRKYKHFIENGIMDVEYQKAAANKLENILYSDDETIYKFAIRDYDKKLINSDGGLITYNNPYVMWHFYKKDSDYSKVFVVKDENNPNQYINVSSARKKDIEWDLTKYGAIETEVTIAPDGTWYDEENGFYIKVSNGSDGKIKYGINDIKGDLKIELNPEDCVTIVDCYK